LAATARYDDVERLTRTCGRLAAEVSAFADWRPSGAETTAAAHAAEAVRIWTAGIGPARLRLRSAREHFSEANRLDPTQGWYSVETGLVEAAAGEPAEADRHFGLALALLDEEPIREALERARPDLAVVGETAD
jgi:cob(I)alamin adenosyltransferase